MTARSSPRDRRTLGRVGRFVSNLARQLDLPFAGGPPAADAASPAAPSPSPRSPDTRLRRIALDSGVLDYAFRRARRKTIGLSVTAGGLTVAAPRWVGIGQVEAAIREREAWVLRKLADLRQHQASIPKVRWEDGGTLPYLGATIALRVAGARGVRAARTSFDADRRVLTVALPPDATPAQLRDRVEGWLQGEARALFRERLAFFEARLGVRHTALRLSSAKTRWGSCSADGRILLNWRLIHFPRSSIDYVVAHELAHLKEMNHGPRFWATVASLLPDYEAARAQVRDPKPEWIPTL